MGFLAQRSLRCLFVSCLLFVSAVSACGTHHHARRQADDEVTVWAPVPEESQGTTIPPEGYVTYNLGKGAYMVTEGSYQSLFLVTTKSVIVVDAPPSITRFIQYAIGNVTSNPVTHLVYSHHHTDHISGARLLVEQNPKLKVIAHENTKRILEEVGDQDVTDRPLPTKTFRRDYKLKVDNQTLELSYKGPNHSEDTVFVWAPEQAILMLVDVIFPGWTTFLNLALTVSVPGFIRAHDEALAYPFETFVGGHLNRPGTREDALIQQEYIQDLFNTCRDAINASSDPSSELFIGTVTGPVAAANPGNGWAIFDAYLDSLTRTCADQTTQRWLGRLAAVDVFAFSNAEIMVESLRIDYGYLGPTGFQE